MLVLMGADFLTTIQCLGHATHHMSPARKTLLVISFPQSSNHCSVTPLNLVMPLRSQGLDFPQIMALSLLIARFY